MSDLGFRTKEAFDHLTRYGEGPESSELFAVLEQLTAINDDIAHARDSKIVRDEVEKAKALLDAVADAYDKTGF